MMKKLYLIGLGVFTLVMLSIASPAIAKEKPPLVICGTTWGKLSGPDLPNKGFVADLVMRVFSHAGYKVEYKIVPWARCIGGAKKMQYDIVASAWHSESVDADYDYMDDILLDTINFVVLEGSPFKDGNFNSFYGEKVAIVRDVTGIEKMLSGHEQIKIVRTASLRKLVRMLVGERFSAIVNDPVSLNEALKEEGLRDTYKLIALNPPLKKNIQAPIISKSHPNKDQIILDFNKSFRELVEKGLYEELIKLHNFPAQRPMPMNNQ